MVNTINLIKIETKTLFDDSLEELRDFLDRHKPDTIMVYNEISMQSHNYHKKLIDIYSKYNLKEGSELDIQKQILERQISLIDDYLNFGNKSRETIENYFLNKKNE
ncbi:hypothetical protein SAMN05421856_1119 [Chryseobacterium taichungense]|uniref:Uncharacterized protein n=1 Tax=Chryseobacterium taichungense TaxID=295069 RepID=A0A1H8CXV7_9FLAO|nr:hypothetical protein [Chryseobacterium taichungense]SEM99953.1 hypothetical protein SAMN05421856_1119 [Chryseobacterium taichungense]